MRQGFAAFFVLLVFAQTAFALECAIDGAAPEVAPDDTGDQTATACGDGALAGGNFSLALGYEVSAVGNVSTALGRAAVASGFSSIALGVNPSAGGDYSTALGFGAGAAGASSTALARGAAAGGEFSIALGFTAQSAGPSSTALGHGAVAGGEASIALGFVSSASGINSAVLGRGAAASGMNSLALGRDTIAVGNDSTALGFRAHAPNPNTIVLGSIPGVIGGTSYANVGLGTTAPEQAVDVARSGTAARFQLSSFTNISNEAPQYIQRRARGSAAVPAAVQNNDNLGLFSFRGHNGVIMGGSNAAITAQAAGNFSESSTPTRLIFSTTPVGKTAPQSVLVITPDGKVQVNGQNLNVPDYVFEDDYQLMPLAELQSFIDHNGHLPGIAPAHEVQSGGLDLAGSQMSQLQKIEELTLYTLQQDAELRELRKEVEELRSLVAAVAGERLDQGLSRLPE